MRADEPPRVRDGRRDGESVRGFEAGRFFRDVADRSRRAAPASSLRLPAGFRAELLDTVPSREQGSWVCLTNDPKGRLISSAQSGKLFRITPPEMGTAAGTRVEPIELDIGDAQGLLYAFNRS
jgi:hypothetical protein